MGKICEMTKWFKSVLCQIWLCQSAWSFCALSTNKPFVQINLSTNKLGPVYMPLIDFVKFGWTLHSGSACRAVSIRAVLPSRYGCFQVSHTQFWLELLLVKKLPRYCPCVLQVIICKICWHNSSIVSLFPAVKVLDFDKREFFVVVLKYVLLAEEAWWW